MQRFTEITKLLVNGGVGIAGFYGLYELIFMIWSWLEIGYAVPGSWTLSQMIILGIIHRIYTQYSRSKVGEFGSCIYWISLLDLYFSHLIPIALTMMTARIFEWGGMYYRFIFVANLILTIVISKYTVREKVLEED